MTLASVLLLLFLAFSAYTVGALAGVAGAAAWLRSRLDVRGGICSGIAGGAAMLVSVVLLGWALRRTPQPGTVAALIGQTASATHLAAVWQPGLTLLLSAAAGVIAALSSFSGRGRT